MGQHLSVAKEFHVTVGEDVSHEPFHVLRTSGVWDGGWRISTKSGMDLTVDGPSATKHCLKRDQTVGTWRIFLDNGKSGDEYVCGWRRIETIKPSRLCDNEDAAAAWRAQLVIVLEKAEAERIASGAPHSVV